MDCTRCGAEGAVKRDNAVYCGKCAMARDWEEIIHVVQTDKLLIDTKPKGAKPKSKAAETSTDGAPVKEEAADELEEAKEEAAPADPFA